MGHMDRVIQGIVGMDRRQIEGQYMSPALSRQGVQITMDWALAALLEGHVFHTQIGDANSHVDFAETAYDEDQPQFALRIPEGVTVIPLSIRAVFEDMAGTDNFFTVSVTSNDIGNGTSTALTATNLKTGGGASLCTPRSLYTANATAAAGLIEIARFMDAFAAEADTEQPFFEWDYRKNSNIPCLVGDATLQAHCHATTDGPEGFLEVVWAEFPTPDLVKV